MSIFQAIILGIVEGVTEFLPISSTGHLILVSELLHISQTEFVKSFEIAIQLGAIGAVVWLYWKDLIRPIILKKLFVAFLPTAVIGLLLYKFVKQHLIGNDSVVIWALFLGGIFLILFERFFARKVHDDSIDSISYKQSMLIGLFQAIAIIPGVSRAAATIIGGLSIGIRRRAIVEFSFLLAVPTMAAATGLDLIKSYENFNSSNFGILAVGFVTAFIVAIIAIKYFLKFIQTHDFQPFGIYRIVAAIAFWILK